MLVAFADFKAINDLISKIRLWGKKLKNSTTDKYFLLLVHKLHTNIRCQL